VGIELYSVKKEYRIIKKLKSLINANKILLRLAYYVYRAVAKRLITCIYVVK
jgi:hypothetical protein